MIVLNIILIVMLILSWYFFASWISNVAAELDGYKIKMRRTWMTFIGMFLHKKIITEKNVKRFREECNYDTW